MLFSNKSFAAWLQSPRQNALLPISSRIVQLGSGSWSLCLRPLLTFVWLWHSDAAQLLGFERLIHCMQLRLWSLERRASGDSTNGRRDWLRLRG